MAALQHQDLMVCQLLAFAEYSSKLTSFQASLPVSPKQRPDNSFLNSWRQLYTWILSSLVYSFILVCDKVHCGDVLRLRAVHLALNQNFSQRPLYIKLSTHILNRKQQLNCLSGTKPYLRTDKWWNKLVQLNPNSTFICSCFYFNLQVSLT